jgi:hypothetical protein
MSDARKRAEEWLAAVELGGTINASLATETSSTSIVRGLLSSCASWGGAGRRVRLWNISGLTTKRRTP